MAENDNLNGMDDASNDSLWDIPNLDGIDFSRLNLSKDSADSSEGSQQDDEPTIRISQPDDIERTQSLAVLAANTSTTLKKITKPEQPTAPTTAPEATLSTSASVQAQDPEATAAFDPLAEDIPDGWAESSASAGETPDLAETMAFDPLADDQATGATEFVSANSEAAATADGSATAPEFTSGTSAESESESESTFTSQFAALSDDVETDDDTASRRTHRNKTTANDRLTRRVLIGGVIGVVVISLIVGLTVFFRNRAIAETHEQLVASCTSSRNDADDSSKTLQKAIKAAQADYSTNSSEVEDTSTLTAIHNAVDQAKASIENEKNLEKCSAEFNDVKLRSIRDDANSTIENQTKYLQSIATARTKVSSSKQAKTLSNAKDTLSHTRQDAQALYSQSEGTVLDENTRTNLKSAIDDADTLLRKATKSVTVHQYNDANTKLTDAMDAVKKSAAEKAAQEAQKAQENNKCAAFAGTYTDGATQFTLNGNCSITYGDNSQGAPADRCADAQGNETSCVTTDNDDSPTQLAWIMQCSQGSACQSGRVDLYAPGSDQGDGDASKARISIGGALYTRQ